MNPALTFRRPALGAEAAARWARERYGLAGRLEELPSERDRNWLLVGPQGERHVLKIAHADDTALLLDLQHRALDRLAEGAPDVATPRVVRSLAGHDLETVEGDDGTPHLARVLTWVPGDPLAAVSPQTPELLASVGRMLGWLDAALQGYRHQAAGRDLKWNLEQAGWATEHLGRVTDRTRRALAERHLTRFVSEVRPALDGLRRAVIHNDANDWNVIVGGGGPWDRRAAGMVDFGDMLECVLVAEPAVACAYAALGKRDPLAAAAAVVGGYHAALALEEAELAVLFPLICARLAVSVVNAAIQRAEAPGNDYLSISEQGGWDALERFGAIHPRFAEYTFRAAAGLEPCPATPAVETWLGMADAPGPLLDLPAGAPFAPLDLSVGSPLVEHPEEPDDLPRFTRKLFDHLERRGARVGVGYYDEARVLYVGENYHGEGEDRPAPRTVHLGIDLFVEPGVGVLAPLPGVVESVRDNGMNRDYGPTVILRHEPEGGPRFWTLYGHLGREVLERLAPGARVGRGDRIGAVGDPDVNGGWPPHLHFQIVTDLLNRDGEFPGVGRADQRAVWLSLSPDPNLVARLPAGRLERPHPRGGEILARRRALIGPSLSLSYRRPLTIVRGWKQFLYDEDGLAYLDGVNNVPHVGHSHPRVVAAIREQAAVLNTNTRYLHERIVEYAERLAATLPDPLRVCFFVNSGSEANELALRMARTVTGRKGVVVVEAGYHGHTNTMVDVSPYKHAGPGGRGAPLWVKAIPMPDPYRGAFRREDPDAGRKYAAALGEAIEALEVGNTLPAAFLCESVLSCGGQVVLPDGFLAEAYRRMRAVGGLCIADEVQVGLGRVGTHWWAFETQGVVPDIVTMGKPIGNGHPLGAVVTTPEIAAAFANGMEFFSTFGGNPVSCAAGLAVLDVMEDEGLRDHAAGVGARLLAGLRGLVDEHPAAGDARGLGLFLGLELVRDRVRREPAGPEAGYVADRLRDAGILASTDGPHRNVIKLKPPLCFGAADADRLVGTLDRVLREDYVRRAVTRAGGAETTQ